MLRIEHHRDPQIVQLYEIIKRLLILKVNLFKKCALLIKISADSKILKATLHIDCNKKKL